MEQQLMALTSSMWSVTKIENMKWGKGLRKMNKSAIWAAVEEMHCSENY